MRPYEMMIVLAPDVPEDELDPSIDTIESYVTRLGGEVINISRDSPWGRRRLAYPIRHAGRDVRDGFYALYYFDAEPTAIIEVEREIRLNDRIIRHMIIALDEQVTILPPVEPEAGPEGAAPAEADAGTATAATVEAATDTGAVEAGAEAEAETVAEETTEVEPATEAAAETAVDETPEVEEAANTVADETPEVEAAEGKTPVDVAPEDDSTKE